MTRDLQSRAEPLNRCPSLLCFAGLGWAASIEIINNTAGFSHLSRIESIVVNIRQDFNRYIYNTRNYNNDKVKSKGEGK